MLAVGRRVRARRSGRRSGPGDPHRHAPRPGVICSADAVVLATGLRPRRLPGQADLAGVHVLRTLDDAVGTAGGSARCSSRLVVVGDGVLGAEIAATARSMGPTSPWPARSGRRWRPARARVAGLLGRAARRTRGAAAAGRRGRAVWRAGRPGHRRVPGQRRSAARRRGRRRDRGGAGDRLARGQRAAGATTGWCATPVVGRPRGSTPSGDVARWHHDRAGHLAAAGEPDERHRAGGRRRGNILGEDRPYAPVPYFWTDQFDAKIQVHGVLAAAPK